MTASFPLAALVVTLAGGTPGAASVPSGASPPATFVAQPVSPWRFDGGFSAMIGFPYLGAHLRADRTLWRWQAGELTAGALAAYHVQLGAFPPEPRISAGDLESTLRASVAVGHAFTLFSGRLRLGAALFLGPSLRIVGTSVSNERYGVQEARTQVGLFFEAGTIASLGVRFAEHWAVNLDAATPLLLSQRATFLEMWAISPPFFGVSVSYFGSPRP